MVRTDLKPIVKYSEQMGVKRSGYDSLVNLLNKHKQMILPPLVAGGSYMKIAENRDEDLIKKEKLKPQEGYDLSYLKIETDKKKVPKIQIRYWLSDNSKETAEFAKNLFTNYYPNAKINMIEDFLHNKNFIMQVDDVVVYDNKEPEMKDFRLDLNTFMTDVKELVERPVKQRPRDFQF